MSERQNIIPEVRVALEGSLRAVQASGSGRTWATGSAPASALFAYVQDFQFTSAQTVTTITDRGTPDHQKITEKAPINVQFNTFWTGGFFSWATASGASLPLIHVEFRASATEIGGGSGYFYQFMGFATESIQLTEGKEGDRISIQGRCLAMTGPTGSGYLS